MESMLKNRAKFKPPTANEWDDGDGDESSNDAAASEQQQKPNDNVDVQEEAPVKQKKAGRPKKSPSKKSTASGAASKKRKSSDDAEEAPAKKSAKKGVVAAPSSGKHNTKKSIKNVRVMQAKPSVKLIPNAPFQRAVRDAIRKVQETQGLAKLDDDGKPKGSTHVSKEFIEITKEHVTKEMAAMSRLVAFLRNYRGAKKVSERDWKMAHIIRYDQPNFEKLSKDELDKMNDEVLTKDVITVQ